MMFNSTPVIPSPSGLRALLESSTNWALTCDEARDAADALGCRTYVFKTGPTTWGWSCSPSYERHCGCHFDPKPENFIPSTPSGY